MYLLKKIMFNNVTSYLIFDSNSEEIYVLLLKNTTQLVN